MLLPLFRCCQVLALLLLLGACQRATYSFRAPATPPGAPLFASAAPIAAAALPAAEALPATIAGRARPRHPRRPRATAPAKAPAAALTRPNLLQTLAAARTASRTSAHQQPLPAGEPVRYRSRGIALLLLVLPLLVGLPLGLHYFYLGYTGRGILTLALGIVAAVLITLGVVGAFGAFFFDVSSSALTLFIIGIILLGVLSLLQLIDIVRIAIGDLKPKNGEYNPRFFQTRPAAAKPAAPGR